MGRAGMLQAGDKSITRRCNSTCVGTSSTQQCRYANQALTMDMTEVCWLQLDYLSQVTIGLSMACILR